MLTPLKTMFILCVLSKEALSGLEIIKKTKEASGNRISMSQGGIYTELSRLKKKGLINSWWGQPTPVKGGRRKRYYAITARGEKLFQETLVSYKTLLAALD